MTEEQATSFDDQLLKEVQSRHQEARPGVESIREIDEMEAAEAEDVASTKFTATYDASPVSNDGPPMDDYDYRGAYDEGTTFAAGGSGGEGEQPAGVELPNKHYRAGALNVGGFDTHGNRLSGMFDDPDNQIRDAAIELGESKADSLNGSPLADVEQLSRVADAMIKEGATFNEFRDSVSDTWDNKSARLAWKTAIMTTRMAWVFDKLENAEIRDPGSPFKRDPDAVISVDDLYGDAGDGEGDGEDTVASMWQQNAQAFYDAMYDKRDRRYKNLTSEELVQFGLNHMARFNANIFVQIGYTLSAMSEGPLSWSPEKTAAFGNLLALYEQVETADQRVLVPATVAFSLDPFIEMGVWKALRLGGKSMLGFQKAQHTIANIFKQFIVRSMPHMSAGAMYNMLSDSLMQQMDREVADAKYELDPTAASEGLGSAGASDPSGHTPWDLQRTTAAGLTGAGYTAALGAGATGLGKVWAKATKEGVSKLSPQDWLQGLTALLGIASGSALEPDEAPKPEVKAKPDNRRDRVIAKVSP